MKGTRFSSPIPVRAYIQRGQVDWNYQPPPPASLALLVAQPFPRAPSHSRRSLPPPLSKRPRRLGHPPLLVKLTHLLTHQLPDPRPPPHLRRDLLLEPAPVRRPLAVPAQGSIHSRSNPGPQPVLQGRVRQHKPERPCRRRERRLPLPNHFEEEGGRLAWVDHYRRRSETPARPHDDALDRLKLGRADPERASAVSCDGEL